MMITRAKKLRDFILLNRIFKSIDADDIVERQRFWLFRWFSLLGVWTCAGMLTEIYATTPMPLMDTVPALAVLFLFNYFLVSRHKNKRAAYFILVSLIFLEIHITSYYTGGLQNNGWFFSAATLLSAYMLLGTRAGFSYSVFVIANQFYFYFISEHTNWVTNMMDNETASVINLDYLLTGSMSLIVISLQLISHEASKTFVLKKLNHSKIELSKKNAELQLLIAERKKGEEQIAVHLINSEKNNLALEQKNKELDMFAYIVSHDLKAPLRAINSMTKFIEEDAGEKLPPETHDHLHIIRGRVNRMDKLITDILAYSQTTRNAKQMSSFTLKDVVHETIDLMLVPEHCKIEIKGGETTVYSDKTRLGQVILNLLVNAIKHHDKEQMEIKVSLTDELNQYHFSVSDNGPGISPQFHEKIFQIFQTLKGKEDTESTGIGLAIVKKIVDDFGGRIWVDSEVGKGTTFHFTQPKIKAELQQQEILEKKISS